MTDTWAIYIENGMCEKSWVGTVYAMRCTDSGQILNCCYRARWDDFAQVDDDEDDIGYNEYILASRVTEAIEKMDFSNLTRVNLGECSHIAISANGYGSPHRYFGDASVEIEDA